MPHAYRERSWPRLLVNSALFESPASLASTRSAKATIPPFLTSIIIKASYTHVSTTPISLLLRQLSAAIHWGSFVVSSSLATFSILVQGKFLFSAVLIPCNTRTFSSFPQRNCIHTLKEMHIKSSLPFESSVSLGLYLGWLTSLYFTIANGMDPALSSIVNRSLENKMSIVTLINFYEHSIWKELASHVPRLNLLKWI